MWPSPSYVRSLPLCSVAASFWAQAYGVAGSPVVRPPYGSVATGTASIDTPETAVVSHVVGKAAVNELLKEILPYLTATFVPPGWDERYTTSYGFTLEDIFVALQEREP